MIRHLAATAAAALVLGALTPALPAAAAETTLTGVLSGSSGPQQDLVIGWVEADDFDNVATATSAADGSYSLGIPDDIGDFFLYTNFSVNPDGGGAALDTDYTGEFFGPGGQRDFLRQGVAPFEAAPTGPFDITLTPVGSVAGLLPAWASGGATLETLGGTTVDSTRIDGDGEFGFSALVPGQYRLRASVSGGNARALSPSFTVQSDETTAVGVGTPADVPPVEARISGVVKNGSTLLPNIYVDIYESAFTDFPIDEVDYPVAQDRTDSKGRYSFSSLHPGDYTLVFTSYSKTAGKSFVRELVVVRDLQALESRTVTGRLASAGIVTGKVTKTAGATFFSADVYTSSRRLVGSAFGTSSDERFSVTGVPAGKYIAYFADSNNAVYDSRGITVKAKKSLSVGTRKLAKKTATLRGSVPGAHGGYVTAFWKSSRVGSTGISSSGTYRIKGLFPGTYTVEVRAQDFTTTTHTVVVSVGMAHKQLSKGTAFGSYNGTALIDGVPVRDGYGGYTTSNSDYAYFFADRHGYFSATGIAGVATFARFYYENRPLPERSPYWYDLPESLKQITLTSGEATSLGTFEFVLHGASS